MKPLYAVRKSNTYPELYVRKYTRKVFYDNLWDDFLVESRGHVLNSSDEVVINPFTKIFNYQENGTTIPRDSICLAIDKINGFMAAATYVKEYDEVIVSTTGSLDSPFVQMAKDIIPQTAINFIYENKELNSTFVFEIVHPDDPHIIKEKVGATLLGCRLIDDKRPYHSDLEKEQLYDKYAMNMDVSRPVYFCDKFDNIIKKNKDYDREGFVVYECNGNTTLKLKSSYYLILKMIARRKSFESVNNMRQKIDEEFYPMLDYINNKYGEGWDNILEQDRLIIMKEFLSNV
jgi:hypothetical protein